MTFLRAIPCPAVALAKEDVPCAAPHFCSMKITEDVRKYAAEQGDQAIDLGLRQKAEKFQSEYLDA